MTKAVATDPNGKWLPQLRKDLDKISLEETDLVGKKKTELKRTLSRKLNRYQRAKILAAGEDKSKVRNYILYRGRDNTGTRPRYLQELNRKKCSTIFQIRARMLKVKDNYKSNFKDNNCRWCNHPMESQRHILESCQPFRNGDNEITMEDFFSDDKELIIRAGQRALEIASKIKKDLS